MDPSDATLVGIAGVVAATILAGTVAAGVLFGFDDSVVRPFAILANEPFAWIVIIALLVAVVGHSYID